MRTLETLEIKQVAGGYYCSSTSCRPPTAGEAGADLAGTVGVAVVGLLGAIFFNAIKSAFN